MTPDEMIAAYFRYDVYLIWSAVDGRCLYVGATYRPAERLREHELKWLTEAYVADVATFPTRKAALAAEANLIRHLQPERNREWRADGRRFATQAVTA